MKYFNEVREYFFYNIAFYETTRRTMFIYCPNCGQVEELDIKKYGSVAEVKKKHIPSCQCYAGVPKYKHAMYEHSNLKYSFDWAEFVKDEARNEVHLISYRHTASFAASEYDWHGIDYCDESHYILKRYPIIDSEKTIDITFCADGSIHYESALYVPMCTYRIKVGDMRQRKQWSSLFAFDLAEGSFAELKGTWLEQYVPILRNMHEMLCEVINLNIAYNEFTIRLLTMLIKFPSVKKLWSAGYKRLIFDRCVEMLNNRRSGYYSNEFYMAGAWVKFQPNAKAVNYQGKSLERILGIEPSKLSVLGDRETLDAEDLRLAKKCNAVGVSICRANMSIISSFRFEGLLRIFNQTQNFKISKLFKYIRHQEKQDGRIFTGYIVGDYVDYLNAMIELKTPLTDDVLYPTSLKAAHDKAVQEIKIVRAKGKEKAFKNAVAPFEVLNFDGEEYSIKVITSVKQLLAEAAKMHNCSAGYIDRIVERNAILFVIREKTHPRKPFCMLELSPANGYIVQNRGVHNKDVPPEVDAFADKWLKKIRRKLKKIMEAA